MASLKSRILIRILSLPVVMGLLTLWPAGTFDFWQVYAYVLLVLVLSAVATGYFLRHDPALLKRRLRTRERQSTQKAVIPVLLVLVVAGFVVPGLDRRYGWSDIPLEVVLAAFALVTLAYLFVFWVMTINSFASRVIEVAENQQVIRTGPYAVIRHPMYTGVTVMYLMTPVALGSW